MGGGYRSKPRRMYLLDPQKYHHLAKVITTGKMTFENTRFPGNILFLGYQLDRPIWP